MFPLLNKVSWICYCTTLWVEECAVKRDWCPQLWYYYAILVCIFIHSSCIVWSLFLDFIYTVKLVTNSFLQRVKACISSFITDNPFGLNAKWKTQSTILKYIGYIWKKLKPVWVKFISLDSDVPSLKLKLLILTN